MGTMTLSTQDVAKALKENGYDEFGVAGWLDMETGSGQHLFNGKNIELSEKQVKKLSEMTKIELEHLVPIYSKEPQKKKARWTEEQKQASHHIKSIKGMSGKELSEAV